MPPLAPGTYRVTTESGSTYTLLREDVPHLYTLYVKGGRLPKRVTRGKGMPCNWPLGMSFPPQAGDRLPINPNTGAHRSVWERYWVTTPVVAVEKVGG